VWVGVGPALTIRPMLPLLPGVKVGAHVEVFKDDERTGQRTLVHTSRPCARCGQPLDGVVIPKGRIQVHMRCPEVRRGE
jgi:hypothetical protein